MSRPGPERTVAEALQRETRTLVLERLRTACRLALGGIVLSFLADLRLPRDSIVELAVLKVALAVAVVAAFPLIGRLRRASWRRMLGGAVLVAGTFCLVPALGAVYTRDLASAAFLLTLITLGGAAFFPWGTRAQLGLVAIAGACLLVPAALVAGTAVPIDSAIAVLAAFAASVYAAHVVDSQRHERKQAEEALRQSEARKGAILATALDAVITMDHEGRIVEFNPAAERMFGYSQADALGKQLADMIVPPAQRASRRGAVATHLSTGEGTLGRRIETIAMRADGAEFPVELAVTRILGGSPPLFTGHLRDISERKQAERALTVAKQQAEEEADIAAALLRVAEQLNAHLDGPELLERVNRLAVDILGCDWSSTFVWHDARRAFRLAANAGSSAAVREEMEQVEFAWDSLPLLQALRSEDLVEVPTPHDQSLIPEMLMRRWDNASSLYVRIARGGEIVGVHAHGYRERTGYFSDVQRRLALGIAQATAVALENARLIAGLQQASRLKSEFLSTVSHELRTPLNVILGFAQMGQDSALPAHERAECVVRIEAAASELSALIESTLEIGRIDTGRDQVRLEPVTLRDLWAELGEVCARLPRQEAVRLLWEDGVPAVSLVTDPHKITVIVRNLVGNACKFTESGWVRAEVRLNADRLCIQVADSGIGIRCEDQQLIFEMFRQADGSDSRRYGGTGLGLYIVRQFVDQLRGEIAVESAPGRGSVFTVTLPCQTGTAAAQPTAHSPAPALAHAGQSQ